VDRVIGVLLLTAALAGCSTDEPGGIAEAEARDSAGVRIVQNGAGAPPRLRLDPQPMVAIGEMEGAAEYQLHNVRHIERLSDGTIVIAGSSDLRFYDGDGRYLHGSGGRGAGPGEFQNISYMRRLEGDTLLVYDSRNRRVSLIDAGGVMVREFTPTLPDGTAASGIAATSSDGALLLTGRREFPSQSVAMHRDTLKYIVVHGDSAVQLPPYSGMEASIRTEGSRTGSSFTTMVAISEVAFGRTTHVSAGADRFYIGSSDSYEIHVYDASGTLEQVIRSAHVPMRNVSDALFAEYAEFELARRVAFAEASDQDMDAGAARREIAESPRAPTVPLYGGLLADDDGGVWVRDYVMRGQEAQPVRWTVFDTDGAVRGAVELPARFRPMHIRGDTVAGVITDEYDVEYVHIYSVGD
jgi:hypothetical protein